MQLDAHAAACEVRLLIGPSQRAIARFGLPDTGMARQTVFSSRADLSWVWIGRELFVCAETHSALVRAPKRIESIGKTQSLWKYRIHVCRPIHPMAITESPATAAPVNGIKTKAAPRVSAPKKPNAEVKLTAGREASNV